MHSRKMCYTCLKAESKELVNLYKNDIDKMSYIDKLITCLSKKLQVTAVMEICWSCIKQLRVTYQFIEMVNNSQESLKVYTEHSHFVSLHNHNLKNESGVCLNDKNSHCNENGAANMSELIVETKRELVKSELGTVNYNSDSSDYFLADLRSDDTSYSNDVYSCKRCSKVYMNSAEFTEHICEVNQDESTVKNEDASKLFVDEIKTECKENKAQKTTKKVRNRPSKYVKKPKPEVVYQCDHCDLTYNKRWKLQKHSARVHVQDKKYVCTYCNRGFKQSYHLREHITTHTGERNYSCTICDKTFQRISSQRRHIRSHEAAPGQKTKRTPFLCTICGKSFPFSNGVQRHMRIHLGIKSHECHLCKRKFTQSTHLHVHMRTHTGEKPYICDTCGEAFSLNASLQKHMTIHQTLSKVEVFLLQGAR